MSIGVFGASGYAGAELLRLAAGHPQFEVKLATADSQAGGRVADLYPSLAAAYPRAVFTGPDPAAADGLDVVFLALPHGASQELVPELRKRAATVVDLAADFRLRDARLYPEWYGSEHRCPELLAEAVTGIPELFGPDLPGANLIASAGCYPTAAALALAPLVRAGVIATDGIVVDAASGVSGAGRAAKAHTHFNAVDEDFTAYGLLDHRHTPEIEQAIGAQVIFTPHLAPMNRGILATCYARPATATATATATGGPAAPTAGPDPLHVLRSFYADAPFVVVDQRSPSTKATLGSNCAHLTARYDPRTGWIIAIAAIDNLTKGAAGQAIQCANLALGLPETAGLPVAGVYP
ncbi:MAG TPA: N-acetyl-gamma-glutamyl-phosphate reductase [Acidimicrobiales bacterium]